jgi:DNA-binding transcriptional ArsR family regulator
MPRAAAAFDVFSAVAEPKRREVLGTLLGGERPVNEIVDVLGWPQPQVSKHLAVLRQVGLVAVSRRGRERVYSVNGERLKPIHEWSKMYEKFWQHQLDRIKERAEAKARQSHQPRTNHSTHKKER